eukprot:Clim_evm5s248 gene=Clim_evmTU5s248
MSRFQPLAQWGPPPPPTEGPVIPLGTCKKSDIVLKVDAHLDILCPDCLAIWPRLKAISERDDTCVFLYFFPLPYHMHSFQVTETIYALHDKNPKSVFRWIDSLFNNQERFENGPTFNMAASQVESSIHELALSLDIDVAELDGIHADQDTRASFKFGCGRGVFGTPWFFSTQYRAADPLYGQVYVHDVFTHQDLDPVEEILEASQWNEELVDTPGKVNVGGP